MLATQAGELKEAVVELREKKKLADRRERFEERLRILEDARDELRPLAQSRVLFVHNDIPCDYDGGRVHPTHKQLQTIRQRFEEEKDWIVEQDLRQMLLKRVQGHREPLWKALKKAWGAHYQNRVTNLPEALLSVLETISGFAGPVEQIRTLSKKVRSYRDDPPTTQEELDDFEEKATQLRKKWNQIDSEDLSPDVKTFLQATVTGDASLDLVTPEVRTWLEKNDLLRRTTVFIGSGE